MASQKAEPVRDDRRRGSAEIPSPTVPPTGPTRVVWWLRSSPGGLLALGVVVGVCAGIGAILFREMVVGFTVLFTGHRLYGQDGRVPNPHLPGIGPWFLLAVPVVGGLIYGPIIDRYAREARGHGVPEVMLAVDREGGRIRPRVAAVKSFASAVCIGAGGSVGREGPIVQIGSALGSSLGQRLGLGDQRMRLLVACGAAGGISATFNAPIAGVFFALELILRDFEIDSFAVVVLSSVTADAIGRAAFGASPFLSVPPLTQRSDWEFVLFALLGVLAAVVGVAFIRILYGMEDAADRLWRGPNWARPACGGLLLGAVLLAVPQLYGVGYPVLQNAVLGKYAIGFLCLLLLGKLVATSLTMSIGGSGGVFAPSLFLGAMLGAAYAQTAGAIDPGAISNSGAYALVGMGAVFAAASRAPITAVVIIFELTGDYHLILPLMLAVVLATIAGRVMNRESIYTEKLRRRGIDLFRVRAIPRVTVGTVARPLPEPLHADDSLSQVVDRLESLADPVLPVLDDQGHYLGVIGAAEASDAALTGRINATAGELAMPVAPIRSTAYLDDVVHELLLHDHGLPVEFERGRLGGWITQRDLLQAYSGDGVTIPTRPAPAKRLPRSPLTDSNC